MSRQNFFHLQRPLHHREGLAYGTLHLQGRIGGEELLESLLAGLPVETESLQGCQGFVEGIAA